MTDRDIVPLIKCAGGKRKLAAAIAEHMPVHVKTYWEPFCGGAAMFAHLANQRRFDRAVLSDSNHGIPLLLRETRDDPQRLAKQLEAIALKYAKFAPEQREAFFYRERKAWNAGKLSAARFVFLRQAAFNGLWRVNRSGELNVPWGKYEALRLPTREDLEAWSKKLSNARIKSGSYESTCNPGPGDLVYVDPPYLGTFSSFTAEGFNHDDHRLLIQYADEWAAKGAHVVCSNSEASRPLFQELWPQARLVKIPTRYSISCEGAGRKAMNELLAVSPHTKGRADDVDTAEAA